MALILDTGPLYASLDRSDQDHAASRELIEYSDEPLVIPTPVLVEVDYLISTHLHPGVMVALLDDIIAGAYRVEELQPRDYERVQTLIDGPYSYTQNNDKFRLYRTRFRRQAAPHLTAP